jgi:iron complex transport system permease protein
MSETTARIDVGAGPRLNPVVPSALARRNALRLAGLLGLAALLGAAIILSLAIGARPIPPQSVIDALFAFDASSNEHLIVRDLRLPRTLTAIAVGIALAIAGALMQALTRNPLADPALLGVNAGAALAVVGTIFFFGIKTPSILGWVAFGGAGIIALLVHAFASVGRGGATPVRLALAGAAVNAMLMGLISTVLILSQDTYDAYRFWMVGSLAAANAVPIGDMLAFIVAGLAFALLLGPALNTIALGDDTARALGTRIGLVRAGALTAVTLLSGAAVAAAGPIAFVGLVVPHLARAICGADQRWLMVYAAVLGPIVIIVADVIGRIALPPGEVQVGIIMAIIGGPLFVAIVRRLRVS